jgi:hypothetical protein
MDGSCQASLAMGQTRTVRRLASMSAPLPPTDVPPEVVPGSAANNSPTDLPLTRMPSNGRGACKATCACSFGTSHAGPSHRSCPSQRPMAGQCPPAPPRGLPWNPMPRSW